MITNNRQIELPLESWGIKNPTSNPLVAPISVLFQKSDLLINEGGNLQKFENQRINKMKKKFNDFYGVIYCTTNLINGKIYIGQSIFNDIDYLGSGLLINRAIKKYDKCNFKKKILCTCKNKKELNFAEQYLIKKYQSCNKNIGYNIGKGGEFGDVFTNHPNKEEIRKKISKTLTGVKHPEWRNKLKKIYQTGKTHLKYSEEGKKNCSEAQKNLYKNGYISPLKGKSKTKEQKIKNREKNFVKISQYTLDNKFIKYWDSPCLVQECLGIWASNIIACCKGRKNKAGNFKWKYVNEKN